ncbi:cytochrome b-c1 complex subunit 9, partial [Drosophila simulans]|uniref:cytochrome b-c1 complex subunit 9 n=1 Tax=Drosophila simulans TaxID=7240 RepID=UPI00192D0334
YLNSVRFQHCLSTQPNKSAVCLACGKSLIGSKSDVFNKNLANMKVIYNTLFKRTSTYAVAIIASAFFFERALDVTSVAIFEGINKGKLWKDIKGKYE